jgi:Fe2+ or Zn2+ uptake regulation protein
MPTHRRTPEDDAAADELTARGLRATRQRIALLQLLRAAAHHATVAELFRSVRRRHRRISRKTVYEILGSLVDSGLAACVADGNGPAHYEARVTPHYHARCRVCDRLFDVPADVDGAIRGGTKLPEGFALEVISVILRGVCAPCRGTT